MSIFKSILAKVLHRDNQSEDASRSGTQQGGPHNAQSASAPASGAGSQNNPAQQGSSTSSQTSAVGGGASPVASQPPDGSTQASAQPGQETQTQGSGQNVSSAQAVDVDAVLTQMQSQHAEQLNWKTSIVDLLKLLGLDSSLAARKQLAAELNYQGSTDDSASMNIWLHKEVMRKLAENGGKLPADIKM